MLQTDKKLKLSNKLQLGIEGPSSQALLFKSGGAFFLILSAILGFNIYHSVKTSAPEVKTVALTTAEANSPAQTSTSEQPQVLGAFDSAPQSAETKPDTLTYTVQKGDTLFNIAQNHNVSWVIIATLNDLKAPYTLKPGTVITIPAEK